MKHARIVLDIAGIGRDLLGQLAQPDGLSGEVAADVEVPKQVHIAGAGGDCGERDGGGKCDGCEVDLHDDSPFHGIVTVPTGLSVTVLDCGLMVVSEYVPAAIWTLSPLMAAAIAGWMFSFGPWPPMTAGR